MSAARCAPHRARPGTARRPGVCGIQRQRHPAPTRWWGSRPAPPAHRTVSTSTGGSPCHRQAAPAARQHAGHETASRGHLLDVAHRPGRPLARSTTASWASCPLTNVELARGPPRRACRARPSPPTPSANSCTFCTNSENSISLRRAPPAGQLHAGLELSVALAQGGSSTRRFGIQPSIRTVWYRRAMAAGGSGQFAGHGRLQRDRRQRVDQRIAWRCAGGSHRWGPQVSARVGGRGDTGLVQHGLLARGIEAGGTSGRRRTWDWHWTSMAPWATTCQHQCASGSGQRRAVVRVMRCCLRRVDQGLGRADGGIHVDRHDARDALVPASSRRSVARPFPSRSCCG